MSHPESISFGLLVGGKSSRMGVDKASLLWHGRPLWRHQLQLAAEIGANKILISGRPPGSHNHVTKVVPDQFPGRGPLEGLASLLAVVESDWLLLVGVDMPFLDAVTIGRLLELRGKNCGVVPTVDGRAEPLAAVYPATVGELARRHADSDERSLQTFVRAAESAGLVRLVDWLPARDCFRSLNTPGEWAAAVR